MPSGLKEASLVPVVAGDRLVDQVTDALRAAITSGVLAPGTHLSVPAVAARMGVSRTPARDALFRLGSEGLVEIIPRRGAVVVGGRLDDLVELFEIREALEGMVGRLAAQRRTESDLKILRKSFQAHTRAVARQDTAAHIEHDAHFHEALATASGNARMVEQLGRTRDQLALLTQAMSVRPGALDDRVIDIHRRILDAVESRDARAAERSARAHVRGILDFYQDELEAARKA